MKVLFYIITLILVPALSLAEPAVTRLMPSGEATPSYTLSPAPAPSPTTMVDGKVFFSLNNVRRSYSTSLTPSSLAIANHPSVQKKAIRQLPTDDQQASPSPSFARDQASTSPSSAHRDILSVFAPDDPSLHSLTPSAR